MPVADTAQVIRRPAVILSLFLVAGCFWGISDPGLSERAVLLALTVCLSLYGCLRLFRYPCRESFSSALVLAAVLLTGAARGVLSPATDSRSSENPAVKQSIYQGLVASDPETELRSGSKPRVKFELLSADGETVSVSLVGRRRSAVSYGDTLLIKGYLNRGRNGGAYLSGWLEDGGVLATGGGNPLKRRLYELRHRSARMLEKGIEDFPEEAGILKALVLGYRRGVPPEMRDKFISTGSLHIFAISGLHVGIACSFAVFLLKSLRVPPSRWFPLLLIVLGGYTTMTGASSSAVRACTMVLVFYGGSFVGRKADLISALAFSAVLIIMFDPRYLVDAGFVLSFVVAGGICILGGAMMKRCEAVFAPDPFLPEKTVRRFVLLRYITSIVVVSLSAWLVSAPLMLYFFGRLSTCGLISNVFIVPVAFLTVLSGCCSMVFGHVHLLLSDLFNHASLGLILLLEAIVEWFSKVSFGQVQGVHFGLSEVLLYYVLLALLWGVIKFFFGTADKGVKTA